MPTYTYENESTGEVKDIIMSYEEMLEFEKDVLEKDWNRVFKLNMASGVGTGMKHDDRFNQVLKNIKAGSGSGCTINTN